MKSHKFTKVIYLLVLSVLFLQACKKPDDKKDTPETPSTELNSRAYVLNQGSYGNGNASVSIYDAINNKMYNNQFSSANNNLPLGDILQSMCLVNDKAYFVINNSNKIEVTKSYPLTSQGTVQGLTQPRYMVALNNEKAYISEWSGTGRVSILNLSTNVVSSSIAVGENPEAMIIKNSKLYVCNAGDTTVAVINTTSNTIEKLIKVPGAPTTIVADNNGYLWVYCFGDVYDSGFNPVPSKSTDAALVKIDASSNTVVSTLWFGASTYSGGLCTNKAMNELYFYFGTDIYKMSPTATSLPSTPLFSKNIYALGVDPANNNIYVGTNGFTSNQKMIRYTNAGVAIDSMEVGIGPCGFVFNY